LKTELLSKIHNRADFDCGNDRLNAYLKQTALQHIEKELAKTHVLLDEQYGNSILGFYTLLAYAVSPSLFPCTVSKKYPKSGTVPVILLGRLAISSEYQNKGLGKRLLAYVMKESLIVNGIIGGLALYVEAKDNTAVTYYKKFGFLPVPENNLHLYLPFSTIRKSLV